MHAPWGNTHGEARNGKSREMLDFLPFVKPDFYFFTCSFEHRSEKVSEQGYTACDHVT